MAWKEWLKEARRVARVLAETQQDVVLSEVQHRVEGVPAVPYAEAEKMIFLSPPFEKCPRHRRGETIRMEQCYALMPGVVIEDAPPEGEEGDAGTTPQMPTTSDGIKMPEFDQEPDPDPTKPDPAGGPKPLPKKKAAAKRKSKGEDE